MRLPVAKDENDFKQNWNLTAGYGFGDKTSYGFHEGNDINMNGGGDIELGSPIYAMMDGEVTSVHDHTTNFGKHLHYLIKGDFGERYVHEAHCQSISVKVGDKIKEGQEIAKLGNTGTTYAHLHHAIKKKPTGIDSVATTQTQLNDGWEDPMAFYERWKTQSDDELSACMTDRNKFWQERDEARNQLSKIATKLGVVNNIDIILAEIEKVIGLDDKYLEKDKQLQDAQTKIVDLETKIKELSTANETLSADNQKLADEVKEQKSNIVEQGSLITMLTQEIDGLKASAKLPIFTGWRRKLVEFISKF